MAAVATTGKETIAVSTAAAATMTMELPTDASSYTFLGKIGQGAFATVWKAKIASSAPSLSSMASSSSQLDQSHPQQNLQHQHQQQEQQYVAVKVLNLDHIDSDLQEIRMEVQSMRLCLHPNILFCHTAFLVQTQLWVVTPFMNKGSSVSCLQQARRSLKQSLEPHILYILQQTLLGLQYIHDNGQIHRDIKGINILLNGNGEVKIADFGVSGWLIPQNEKAKTFVGTPCWMAPGEYLLQ
jgi:serine/threonine protein kinase